MKEFYEENKKLINKILLLLGIFGFLYLFVNVLFQYIAPFFIGYIISLILNPLVGLLHNQFKINRGVSGFFLIVICILLISILGTSIMNRIVTESKQFAQEIPSYIVDAKIVFDNVRLQVDDLIELIPEELSSSFDSATNQIVSSITSTLQSGVQKGSVNIVTTIPGVLMGIVLSILSAFFFIKDKALITESFKGITPDWVIKHLNIIKKGIFRAVGGYIKGQSIVMCLIASICVLGLTIIKSPYSLLIGLVIGFVDALPIFGSGAILWPWILYNFISGNYSQAIGLGVIYGIVFITRQVVEPKVVGEQIGVHPLIMLMSVYVGLRMFGALGIFVGPAIVIIAKTVLQADLEVDENAVYRE